MHGGSLPRAASAGSSATPGADSNPFSFLSYAHSPRDDRNGRDPDLWVGQLYEDLCEHIRNLAGLPVDTKAGFMDRELRHGHEWPDRLSNALATCRVFVPLCSRRYFKSEHCGQEWFAFNRRRLNQRARTARAIETIVPALWIPVPGEQIPEAAASVQYNSSEFSPA